MVRWERREHDRINIARPCKVLEVTTGKYVLGATCNISPTGALIEVSRPMALRPGDRVYVGIAMKRRQVFLQSQDMIEAEVVRSATLGNQSTTLAIRFIEPQATGEVMVARRAA